jgi:hypothetical protein
VRNKPQTMSLACLATLGMALGFFPTASAAPCNQTFVVQHGRLVTVLPTGVDDTGNLQCAFDSAVAAGPGGTVQLERGTYHTRQIVVNNFKGTFIGAGAESSVLTNLPNLHVTPVDMYDYPPSATNPWPSLVSFVGGSFQVSDVGIHITGATPTTGWTIFGFPTLYDLAHGFAVLGTTANASFSRVDVEGEYSPNPVCNYNLYNGIYFEGFIGAVSPPISGSFVVHDSTFQHLGSATPVTNLSHASVLISHNKYQDVFDAMDVSGLINSWYDFSFNTVEGTYGGYLYDGLPVSMVTQVTSSEILVTNNVFSGQYGVYLDATFGGGATCQVLSNTLQNVTDLGIYLGIGTSHCLVMGNGNTTIQNLGSDNVILGKASTPKTISGPTPQLLHLGWSGAHR